jgi:hypothetical protein
LCTPDVGYNRYRENTNINTKPSFNLNGVIPEVYLRDTLKKIAEGHPTNRIGELMPWHSSRPHEAARVA